MAKMLLLLLGAMGLMVLVATRLSARHATPGQARTGRWLMRWAIWVLRVSRAGLVLLTLLAAGLAFKLLLSAGVGANAGEGQGGLWVAAALVVGVVALFGFLLWSLRQLKNRINFLHQQLGQGTGPLLGGKWSL